MGRLEQKTAIITGGGSGIGAAIARKFVEHGATVHILELDPDKGELLAEELNQIATSKCFAHACDVSDRDQVEDVIEAVSQQGAIDILVNNAGIGFVGTVEQTTEADLDRLYQINIKGVYQCLHAVIPRMKAQGAGNILNMASVAASMGIPERFGYSMTKGAVLTMTYATAVDYLDYNIRCNCISPARVHTPFVDAYLARNYPGKEKEEYDRLSKTQPIGRMAKPEEVADLAVFLCSEEAGFITGTDFPIDGGFIKLPHRLPRQ